MKDGYITASTVYRTTSLDLCTSCGVCHCACPVGAISMRLSNGQHLPEINAKKCVKCGICLKLCPGIDLFPKNLDGKTKSEIVFGDNYLSCYNAYSVNPESRYNSTSGGVITSIILELIKTGCYHSAFVLPDYDTANCTVEPRLIETSDPDTIFNCARSKYVPVSAYNIIEAIKKRDVKKRVAVITPCVLAGIIKYSRVYNLPLDNFLFLGLFCHKTLNLNAIKFYEYLYAKNGEKIDTFQYRVKEKYGWPGHSKIVFDSKREVFVDESARMRCKTFFQLNRCLYCLDKFNNCADISFGDGYLAGNTDKEGSSNLIIRTKKGKEIFDNCSYLFNAEPIGIDEIKIPQHFYEERVQRLEHAVIFAKQNDLDIINNIGNIDTVYAKQTLLKYRRFIKWGQTAAFLKIKAAFRFYGFFENQSVIWHLDTLKFAYLFLNGMVIYAKTKLFPKDKKLGDNIIILGGELFNKGAQAMVFTVIGQLRRKYPDKRFYLFSHLDFDRQEEEKDMYNFKILPWDLNAKTRLLFSANKIFFRKNKYSFMEQEIKKTVNNAFCFIDISGFAISSQFGDRKTFDYVMNILTAIKNRARFYIFPQSIGPFDYSKSRKFFIMRLLRIFVRYPEKIFVREFEGINYLNQFNPRNVLKSHDIVLINKGFIEANIYKNQPKKRLIAVIGDSVGIIPNERVNEKISQRDIYGLYAKLIRTLIESGKKVYLLRHSYEDLAICRNLKSMFSDNSGVIFLENDMSCIELESIIKGFNFIIGSRYHSIIHAYRNAVPALVIGWAVKYMELLSYFDQQAYSFDVRNGLDPDKINLILINLINDYKTQSVKIAQKLTGVDKVNPFDSIN